MNLDICLQSVGCHCRYLRTGLFARIGPIQVTTVFQKGE